MSTSGYMAVRLLRQRYRGRVAPEWAVWDSLGLLNAWKDQHPINWRAS